jgi:serine/threonine protein kinase
VKDEIDGKIYALKKVKTEASDSNDGFPITSIREINILKSLSYTHIVNLKEVVVGYQPNR